MPLFRPVGRPREHPFREILEVVFRFVDMEVVEMRLPGKHALVTGGTRGMGRAIALGFAREGADVAIFYRQSEESAHEVVEEIRRAGRRGVALRVDTSSRVEVVAGVAEVLGEFEHLDILVNNAGIATRRHFLELTDEEWDRVHSVNLRGYFLVGQTVARHMAARRSGVIINVSSLNQQKARRERSHYLASKGGVLMLTRGMAVDLAPYGIRVNALAPGTIETDINRADLVDPAFRKERESNILLGRLGRPEEIVGAALFLASDDSSFVTGASLLVDGGATAV